MNKKKLNKKVFVLILECVFPGTDTRVYKDDYDYIATKSWVAPSVFRSRLSIKLISCFLLKHIPIYVHGVIFKRNRIILFSQLGSELPLFVYLKWNSLLDFKQLMDLWAVDYPSRNNRFEINYNLLSVRYSFRLVVKVCVGEWNDLHTLNIVYRSCTWLEREVWDLFGIFFMGNVDLRRIVTDYGFLGYPLRKDFPLFGYVELRYSDSSKYIIFEFVEFSQEFRFFSSIGL